MEDFDSIDFLESLNLSGQSQPSVVLHSPDPQLDDQILNNLLFPHDPFNGLQSSFDSTGHDDISNALIDAPDDLFAPSIFDSNPMPDYQNETDDTSVFLLPPLEEITRRPSLEENIQSMHLTESHTDRPRSSMTIQTGSSPVEPKAIDKWILASPLIRQPTRPTKIFSRTKRTSGYHQPSSTVAPINVVARSPDSPLHGNGHMQCDRVYSQQMYLDDGMELKKIEIICQPRSQYRPRTQNESRIASHYIRCKDDSPIDYPTIHIQRCWGRQSMENFIEVTLVGVDHVPHNYAIENKACKNGYEADALIFRENQPHTMYFRVTDEDYAQKIKTFFIELIKCKQDGVITKDLIKQRQLEQSKLRFTRIYRTAANTYQRDEISTEYSCTMTEAVPDVAVEHLGPLYGPMSGDKVYMLIKGRLLKDELVIEVTEEITGMHERPIYSKNCNLVYFTMPAFTHSQLDRAVAQITVYYKGEQIYQKPYSYNESLDQALAGLNLGDDAAMEGGLPPPTNHFDALNVFASAGAASVFSSSKKAAASKRPKRLNQK